MKDLSLMTCIFSFFLFIRGGGVYDKIIWELLIFGKVNDVYGPMCLDNFAHLGEVIPNVLTRGAEAGSTKLVKGNFWKYHVQLRQCFSVPVEILMNSQWDIIKFTVCSNFTLSSF